MPIDVPAVTLTEDEIDDLLYLARVGDEEDLNQTLTQLAHNSSQGADVIVQAAIDPVTGNTCLHYACANGHLGIVSYLTRLPPGNAIERYQKHVAWTVKGNASGNTVLHYAALNGHLEVIKALLAALESHYSAIIARTQDDLGQQKAEQTRGEFAQLKAEFLARKNNAGFDAAYEAETSGKEEVVNFLLGVMDEADAAKGGADELGAGEETDEVVDGTNETAPGANETRDRDAQDVSDKTKDLSIG